MPRFDAFRGLRYAPHIDLREVTSPPYDVVDDTQRARLAAAPYNAVHVDLPVDEPDADRYQVACRTLSAWERDGVLVTDDEPTLTVHRMTFTDETGVERATTGVIGALELWAPGAGHILPHENTTRKARSDRLDMLRVCRHNLSAIWALSTATGLTALFPTDGVPDADWVDPDGVRHTIWIVRDQDRCGRISAAILDEPVVIADGHHRYETSLQYRDERRVSDGAGTPADLTLCYVVELVEDELTVQPIHRLFTGIAGVDLTDVWSPYFEFEPADSFGPDAVDQLVADDVLGLVTPDGSFRMRPRASAFDPGVELDTVRIETARSGLGPHEVRYQHGVENVVDAVASGTADAGVLGRPATIAQIRAIAGGGERMPPKTTFFAPKPATGIVFRSLA